MIRKSYIIAIVLFAAFFVAFKVEKAQAAAACGCYASGLASRVGSEIQASYEGECDQYCANQKASNSSIIYYRYGESGLFGASKKAITKTANGETLTGLPMQSCQCDGGTLRSELSKKVFNVGECKLFCTEAGASKFNYNYLGYGNLSSSSSTTSQTTTGSSGSFQTATDRVSGSASTDSSKGLIKCGRAGQRMCHLCDLIVGLNTIIKYIFSISIVVALTIIVVGSIMYIVSAGDKKMIENAKGAIRNAAIGMVIVLSAWLIVNYSMKLLQTKSNLGISQVSGWNNFTCN